MQQEYTHNIYLSEKIFKSLKRCLLISINANDVFDRQFIRNKRFFNGFLLKSSLNVLKERLKIYEKRDTIITNSFATSLEWLAYTYE